MAAVNNNNKNILLCCSVFWTSFLTYTTYFTSTECEASFKDPSVHALAAFGPLALAEASALEITQGTCDSCSVLCLLFELSCLRNVCSILLIGFNYHLQPLMNTVSLCLPWHFFSSHFALLLAWNNDVDSLPSVLLSLLTLKVFLGCAEWWGSPSSLQHLTWKHF